MAKEMDSTLHCRFTIFTASREYSKWTNPSGANPTTVAETRTPLGRVYNTLSPTLKSMVNAIEGLRNESKKGEG